MTTTYTRARSSPVESLTDIRVEDALDAVLRESSASDALSDITAWEA